MSFTEYSTEFLEELECLLVIGFSKHFFMIKRCQIEGKSIFKHVSVTGEKMLITFCPGRGSNRDLLRGSQTLYRIAIKAGLYRKAVQVCIIPNITTYSPSILDSSPNLN